jgi:hypothetical protein
MKRTDTSFVRQIAGAAPNTLAEQRVALPRAARG